jgi:hypothetical protein
MAGPVPMAPSNQHHKGSVAGLSLVTRPFRAGAEKPGSIQICRRDCLQSDGKSLALSSRRKFVVREGRQSTHKGHSLNQLPSSGADIGASLRLASSRM